MRMTARPFSCSCCLPQGMWCGAALGVVAAFVGTTLLMLCFRRPNPTMRTVGWQVCCAVVIAIFYAGAASGWLSVVGLSIGSLIGNYIKFFTDAQAFAWASVGALFVLCCLLPVVFCKWCVCRSSKVAGFNAEWGPGGKLVSIPQPDHTQDECVALGSTAVHCCACTYSMATHAQLCTSGARTLQLRVALRVPARANGTLHNRCHRERSSGRRVRCSNTATPAAAARQPCLLIVCVSVLPPQWRCCCQTHQLLMLRAAETGVTGGQVQQGVRQPHQSVVRRRSSCGSHHRSTRSACPRWPSERNARREGM